MTHLVAYLLLATITLGWWLLTKAAWKRCGDVSVPLGSAIIYVWTLLGAWAFIGDDASAFQGYRIGFNYYYLMERMFPFVVDGMYVKSLGWYGIFALGLFGTLRLLVPGKRGPVLIRPVIGREVMVALGLGALGLSIVCAWPIMQQAIAEKRSVYTVLHEWTGWRRSAMALCNEAAAMAFVWGSAIHMARNGEWSPLNEKGRFLPAWSYAAGLLLLCIFLTAIGDRHTLFQALVLSVIHLIGSQGRKAWRNVGVLGSACVLALLAGGSLRGLAWTEEGLAQPTKDDEVFTLPAIQHIPRHTSGLLQRTGEKVFSNEFFCAHFSMYGVLSQHIPPAPGISFRYLASSLRPASERSRTAYDHYAMEAHLVEGQGYTIHHATAWYLNFGTVGVLLGGLVLGGLWVFMFRMRTMVPFALKGFAQVLPWCFVAFLPSLIRNGPEAFKSLLFEGLALPFILVAFSSLFGRRGATPAGSPVVP
jgi:hypothetical protein